MKLLPCPRVLKCGAGFFTLPDHAILVMPAEDPELQAAVRRLVSGASCAGIQISPRWSRGPSPAAAIRCVRHSLSEARPEKYAITINAGGVRIHFSNPAGFRASVATLRQLFRQFGRRLPCLTIEDWPDFHRRGVMLDISRGRVPTLKTLLGVVDHLADFKINEFQLYIEHTFAYRKYRPIWKSGGALTGGEIRRLDARCRELGIDLVPNQNSFGHMRAWLAYPPLRKLAEVPEPYENDGGKFLRVPSTLAPCHPDTLAFITGLYDELLRHFSSRFLNVGCDETWDLGRGQSKALCAKLGAGAVYLKFLKQIHREVRSRGRRMMFWGDMILQHRDLISQLPRDVVALDWGYEASHPFDEEARVFSRAGIEFYVCPGTSTWMTLIGRHDNALANLRNAAIAGRRHGAAGYLVTDWGDGGHPQPLAVSYLPYLAGASLAWCAASFKPDDLLPVLSRDIFCDSTGRCAEAARDLGLAHLKLRHKTRNSTALGTTIAAPAAGTREVFCWDGLGNYRKLRPAAIRGALAEISKQLKKIGQSQPRTSLGRILKSELSLAGRMAAQSCHLMLWQHVRAKGDQKAARRLARSGIRQLRTLGKDFRKYWPLRNKGQTENCAAFLEWRIRDYEHGTPC